jgi:hypothetical protein
MEDQGMLSKLARILVAPWVVALVACGNDPQPQNEELDATQYRCLGELEDGACFSMPSNCPVTILPHTGGARCPEGDTLIPVGDDHCPRKLICVD